MDLDQIDRTLARFRATVGVISSNLVELESDGDRMRLDQTTLTGATATRWSEAKVELAHLWQWFTQLNELLERADQLRGKKPRVDDDRMSQLTALLSTPSVELSTAAIPLGERGLLGARQITSRCTPDELLNLMTAAFAAVEDVISAAGRAWATHETRLQALNAELAQTAALASSLGPQHTAEVDHLRARLGRLGDTVGSDPLSVGAGDTDPLEVSLRSVGRDIQALATLRDGIAARVTEARARLDDVRATVQAGADAHRETLEKISAPAVPAPLTAMPDLERELERAIASAATGDWRAAGRVLADWTGRVNVLLAEARRVRDANRAPIEARNELRGRLDAYRSKAFRLGLLEHGTVAGLYQRAHQVLYSAPTDLVVAADLVSRYQQAIAGLARTEVPREM